MNVKIGLETHVQLNSKTKLFCSCPNTVNLEKEPEPNTYTCEVCLGMPGSKPQPNESVVSIATRIGLALNCSIAKETYFSRKTYFYPDMAKNFQITQYEVPVAKKGFAEIDINGKRKKIRIRRIHIEEDPAKTIHIGGLGGKYTLIDYNRSGTPLVEIVTDPDFTEPQEARLFLQKLTTILEYLGVYDSSSRAVLKSDANISIKGGERVEVKNITGTKEIEHALNYEIIRQRSVVSKGGKVFQETRMWNPESNTTQEMRTKETEEDYGYIFDPDLPEMRIGKEDIEKARKSIPELPDEKYRRFVKQFKLSPKVAESIVSELETAELFEHTAKRISPGIAGSWIAGYLKKSLNWHDMSFRDSGLEKKWIIDLLDMFEKGKITDRNGELVIRKMIEEKTDPQKIVRKYKLGKAEIDLGNIVLGIVSKNKKAAEDYKSGNKKALDFLVGQIIKETKGQVDAKDIRKALEKALK